MKQLIACVIASELEKEMPEKMTMMTMMIGIARIQFTQPCKLAALREVKNCRIRRQKRKKLSNVSGECRDHSHAKSHPVLPDQSRINTHPCIA